MLRNLSLSLLLVIVVSLPAKSEILTPNGDCRLKDNYEVCTYNWQVTYRETMALYNETRDSAVPVYPKADGKLYKRVLDIDCSREVELTQEELDQVQTGDGSYRTAIVVNGQLPGPPIVVRDGTRVVVRVTNRLITEGISIHWHGMVQKGTPWMDGVASVSHCLINPGETFTYRFLATPPGTHWYHSHAGVQRTDGLYGPLIVLESEDQVSDRKRRATQPVPDFEGEFILQLHDWMREPSIDINNRILWEMQRFTPGYSNTAQCFYQTRQLDGTEIGVTPFVSGLINGKGWHYDLNGNAENTVIPLESVTVKFRKFYRFRLINAAMIYAFRVSIDGHDLHVFATDGNYVTPQLVESIIIHTGERFDFYIESNKPQSNYWIRADTLEVDNIKNERVNFGHVEAILHYESAPVAFPTTQLDVCTATEPCHVANCPFGYHPADQYSTCIPISEFKAPGHAKVPKSSGGAGFEEHFINFHFSGNPALRSSVNGRRFIPPSAPPATLPGDDYSEFMVLCNDEECEQNHCDCTYFVEITPGNTVQIVLYNIRLGEGLQGTAHPVHVHGHHFYVLKAGYPQYDETTGKFLEDTTDIDCNGSVRCNAGKWANGNWSGDNIPGLNLDNPPIKDTVIVPVGGYVIIRFLADNRGWWFVHCHIEIHQVEGMALMLKEGSHKNMPPTPKGFKTCGNFDWSDEEFEEAVGGTEPGHGRYHVQLIMMMTFIAIQQLL